jgi:hypothetical protein
LRLTANLVFDSVTWSFDLSPLPALRSLPSAARSQTDSRSPTTPYARFRVQQRAGRATPISFWGGQPRTNVRANVGIGSELPRVVSAAFGFRRNYELRSPSARLATDSSWIGLDAGRDRVGDMFLGDDT